MDRFTDGLHNALIQIQDIGTIPSERLENKLEIMGLIKYDFNRHWNITQAGIEYLKENKHTIKKHKGNLFKLHN